MNKLKKKIFFLIFSILSLITAGLFITFNGRIYEESKSAILDILNKPFNDSQMIFNQRTMLMKQIKEPKFPKDAPVNIQDDKRKIFLDSKVYTVLLDDHGKYLGVISHIDDEKNDVDTKEIANSIISKYKKDKLKTFIGNLYVNKYSYSFKNDNTLIIIDNTNCNNHLVSNLIVSLMFLLIILGIIAYVCYVLTKWIIKPVIDTFNSQNKFIEDASHELKTPLAVIMSSLDAYVKDNDKKWLDNIRDESDRMSALVKGLLDLSEIENEKYNYKNDFNQENISMVFEKEILTCESLFYESNIKMKYDIEKDIFMNCNKNQMKQLITILLDNAIKHCEQFSSDLEKPKRRNQNVKIALSKNDKNILLEISNKSKPISKEDEEKIFDRFYKSDESRNRDKNSYGLGLAIAKEIVTNHGGSIRAKYESGYTTFSVCFKTE